MRATKTVESSKVLNAHKVRGAIEDFNTFYWQWFPWARTVFTLGMVNAATSMATWATLALMHHGEAIVIQGDSYRTKDGTQE